MVVPTSEVGYTIAITRRETTKVHKNMWWHWGKKNSLTELYIPFYMGVKFGLPMPTEDSRCLKIGWQSNKRKVENASRLAL
jgi:hypothetical protein